MPRKRGNGPQKKKSVQRRNGRKVTVEAEKESEQANGATTVRVYRG